MGAHGEEIANKLLNLHRVNPPEHTVLWGILEHLYNSITTFIGSIRWVAWYYKMLCTDTLLHNLVKQSSVLLQNYKTTQLHIGIGWGRTQSRCKGHLHCYESCKLAPINFQQTHMTRFYMIPLCKRKPMSIYIHRITQWTVQMCKCPEKMSVVTI